MRFDMMSRWKQNALMVLLLALTACSSDSGGHEEPIPSTGKDLMRFTSLAKGTEAEAPQTRASETLKTGFLVSTYKKLGSVQQTVMHKYEAKYNASSTNQWTIYGMKTGGYWQDQYECYWDLSARSYCFYAIAPCPAPGDIPSVTLSDAALELPVANQVEFHNETCTNGTISNTGKETHFIAQVERRLSDGTAARDYDLWQASATGQEREINTTSNSPSRSVALPFHHLICKVRFGLYTTVPQLPGDDLQVISVTITASTAEGFVHQANGYQASSADFFSGDFITKHRASGGTETILTRNDTNKQLNQCLKNSPWWLGPQDGAGWKQIPQAGITLTADVQLNDGKRFSKSLTPPDGATTWTWKPSMLYTYYINISSLDPIEITLDATLIPWDVIDGIDITTGLED